MVEGQGDGITEWPVEFHFKLQGGRDLGDAGGAFADRIAGDAAVLRVVDIDHPGDDSIRVHAVVTAGSHEEAGAKSDDILDAARAAAGTTIADWSTTGYWCGHDCAEIPEDF